MSENTNEENFSMDWYSIGRRIEDARVKAGFGTQVALAKAAGIRSQAISDLEALSVHPPANDSRKPVSYRPCLRGLNGLPDFWKAGQRKRVGHAVSLWRVHCAHD